MLGLPLNYRIYLVLCGSKDAYNKFQSKMDCSGEVLMQNCCLLLSQVNKVKEHQNRLICLVTVIAR